MNLDLTSIIASVATGLLGIGAVSLFLKSHVNAAAKYAMIAKDVTETLSDLVVSFQPDADGKITLTADEVNKLKADVVKFRTDLKA